MRDWVNRLAQSGELLTVKREVDPRFELAAVTKRAQEAGNRPLLFENVRGTGLRVATNLFADATRLRSVVGGADEPFAAAYAKVLDAAEARVEPAAAEVRAPGDLQQGRLTDLPLITYHERDAGPYFTAAIVLALDPDTGVPNLSFHRAMYVSPDELRLRLGDSHDLTDYQRRAEQAGQALPVALLIGVPPSVFFAAGTHLPAGINEYALAAELAGGPVEVYAGRPHRASGSQPRKSSSKAASFRAKGARKARSAKCWDITCLKAATMSWKLTASPGGGTPCSTACCAVRAKTWRCWRRSTPRASTAT